MRREPKERACRDEPLGGVVLVPLYGISVVHGKLVMEIVVPLAKGQEGGEEVITRGVLVIERRLPEPVGEGVDAESRLYACSVTSHAHISTGIRT